MSLLKKQKNIKHLEISIMPKGFKEYIKSYLGGFRLGNYDNITPIASLGDVPPKDKHSDLYTDENPKGTIHGLGFTDGAKARQSVNKIKGSGKTHAHKMQAAIAMSQRAKVASQRAKDPEKKKNLGQAHKVYQRYIDTNKKSKD